MNEISIFLFGAMTIAIPLIIWYLQTLGKKYVADCQAVKANLDKVLVDLNQLHNAAVVKYQSLDTRLTKIETLNAARNYERNAK